MTGRVELQKARLLARPRRPARSACLVLLASLLAGCSSSLFGGKTETVENNDPPDVIYGKAEKLVDTRKFADAARAYEETRRRRSLRHQASAVARHRGAHQLSLPR